MAGSLPNDTRVTARLPASGKDTLQRAADLRGATLNQFMVQAAIKEAKEIIDKEQMIHLSAEDADRIFSLIENPPSLNSKLKEAIKHHQAFFSEAN